MRRTLALVLLVALPGPLAGQEGTAQAAAEAARRLEEAGRLLAEAEGAAGDRLAALTDTVRAYEEGLALLRETLRRVVDEKSRIETGLAAEQEEVARLLGALQSLGQSPEPVLMLHPAGPVGSIRAGLMVAEVTAALQAEAEDLRTRARILAEAEALQEKAAETLRQGLSNVQAARAALAAAAADRTELPRAYTEDPVATALLMASAESLGAFAEGLAQTVDEQVSSPPDQATARKGGLTLPVDGPIERRPGEPDSAGVTRPGLVIAAEPRALVTVPVSATLRFRGPLLDYGTVAILEPAPETLFIVAGLGQVFGNAGEILPEGAPLGLMGGETPEADAILTGASAAGDAVLPEYLYLEVREAGTPVDPGTWFQLE